MGAILVTSKMPAKHIMLKRVYEKPAPSDGTRVLVDRLWPRGVKKSEAAIDYWCKDLSPSTGLRKWFGHDPERWPEFKRRFRSEVDERQDQLDMIRNLAKVGPITLIYSARDEVHNDAVVLREVLLEEAGAGT